MKRFFSTLVLLVVLSSPVLADCIPGNTSTPPICNATVQHPSAAAKAMVAIILALVKP